MKWFSLLHVTKSKLRDWYVENLWQYSWLEIKPTLIFTCSKSTLETLEKGVKYVQS